MWVGQLGEVWALLWFALRGWWPLPRPRQIGKRERIQADLLLRRGQTILLVEVKTRPSLEKGLTALHPAQAARLATAARALAARYPACGVRVDLAIVVWPHGGWRLPRLHHIPAVLDALAPPRYPRR